MTTSPRDRRLAADARGMSELLAETSILQADAKGHPPTHYRLKFHGTGLACDARGTVYRQEFHEVHLELGAAYPRMMPVLVWRTPVWHPNISTSGVVCLGGYGTHWVPSLTLAELCTMLWDMIRYRNFDVNSPYNREAALWVREQSPGLFPVDQRPLRNLVQDAARRELQPSVGDAARPGRSGHADSQPEIVFM